ncbi:MAG: hypothetical protein RLZZ338_4694 [Cyanobacteriota bacterium]|jgi:hypothetical protein
MIWRLKITTPDAPELASSQPEAPRVLATPELKSYLHPKKSISYD